MKTNYLFGYEIYTKNPTTGETGWDIKFIEVVATSHRNALEMLAKWPLFDVIILNNYKQETDEPVTGRIFEVDAVGYERINPTMALFKP